MHIARRFTTAGQDPYEAVRVPHRHQRDPQPRRVGRLRRPRESRCRPSGARSPATSSPRNTSARPACRRVWRRSRNRAFRPGCGGAPPIEAASRGAGRERPPRRRNERQAGLRPAGRHLDLLGLEGRLFRCRGRRPRLLRRDPADAGAPDGRAELAAMVQHRAPLGLWHRRPGAGPLLRRSPDRRAARLGQRLRASAAACLLHPVGRRRPRQRGRHHGSLGARGAALQIRLGHRLEFLEAPRRRRAAVGRRPLLRADELSARSATAPPARSNPAARRGAPPRW